MEEDSAIRPAGQLPKRGKVSGSFFRKVISLALVPPHYLGLVWARLNVGAPDDDKVAQFTDYFQATWLNRHYYIAEWSVYNGPQTNNHVEGWHNKINLVTGKNHQNIYEIVELFKSTTA